MKRLCFGLKVPRRIPTKEYAQPDYGLPNIELVGEGVYSALMLEELLKQRVNISCYTVKDLPKKTEIENYGFLKVRTFNSERGLARVIGNGQYTVLFNLGLKVPDSVIERLNGDLLNIHPSKLPEYAGVADPVKEMVKQGRTYGHVTIHEVTNEIDGGKILGHMSFRFKPNPKNHKYSSKLVSEIYRDSVIPAGAELLKNFLKTRRYPRIFCSEYLFNKTD
jgi:methionyl-tRNA formyltransferase